MRRNRSLGQPGVLLGIRTVPYANRPVKPDTPGPSPYDPNGLKLLNPRNDGVVVDGDETVAASFGTLCERHTI